MLHIPSQPKSNQRRATPPNTRGKTGFSATGNVVLSLFSGLIKTTILNHYNGSLGKNTEEKKMPSKAI